MPRMPAKPCAYPGCPNLTTGKYCEVHARTVSHRYERYGRDDKHSQHYGSRWQTIRQSYVHAHPLCERCAEAGRYVPVDEVHHIVPLSDGGTNDVDNLISLCRKCHAEIHGEMGTRSHNGRVYEYKK